MTPPTIHKSLKEDLFLVSSFGPLPRLRNHRIGTIHASVGARQPLDSRCKGAAFTVFAKTESATTGTSWQEVISPTTHSQSTGARPRCGNGRGTCFLPR